jgi:hypothetical protein
MDDIVLQAMIKWPNVPSCYGWLGLDGRGNWYMRDDSAQAAGSFASGIAAAKGSRLQHTKLIEFIQRNYAADADGQWYFQNGPQRVYVELEATPWIWRVADDFSITAHDGRHATWQQCWMDERGWLYCSTNLGLGLVHTQDVGIAADAIEKGLWTVADINTAQLTQRYAYVSSPLQAQATKKPVQ